MAPPPARRDASPSDVTLAASAAVPGTVPHSPSGAVCRGAARGFRPGSSAPSRTSRPAERAVPEHDRFRSLVFCRHCCVPGRAPAWPEARLDLRPEGLADGGPGRPGRRPRADSRGHLVLDHRGRGSGDRPVRLLHHGRRHLGRRWPSGDDLRRDRCRRPGDRAPEPGARLRLPRRRRCPRRCLPGRSGRAGRGETDEVHPALGDGRFRQLPCHPDLHGPDPGDARRPVGRLPADRRMVWRSWSSSRNSPQ